MTGAQFTTNWRSRGRHMDSDAREGAIGGMITLGIGTFLDGILDLEND